MQQSVQHSSTVVITGDALWLCGFTNVPVRAEVIATQVSYPGWLNGIEKAFSFLCRMGKSSGLAMDDL